MEEEDRNIHAYTHVNARVRVVNARVRVRTYILLGARGRACLD